MAVSENEDLTVFDDSLAAPMMKDITTVSNLLNSVQSISTSFVLLNFNIIEISYPFCRVKYIRQGEPPVIWLNLRQAAKWALL